MKSVSTIVITGGPCAGKTTAKNWIFNYLTKLGYKVIFIDETATQMITGGYNTLGMYNKYTLSITSIKNANSKRTNHKGSSI